MKSNSLIALLLIAAMLLLPFENLPEISQSLGTPSIASGVSSIQAGEVNSTALKEMVERVEVSFIQVGEGNPQADTDDNTLQIIAAIIIVIIIIYLFCYMTDTGTGK